MMPRCFGLIFTVVLVGGVSAAGCKNQKTSAPRTKAQASSSEVITSQPHAKAGEQQYIVRGSEGHSMDGQTFVVTRRSETLSEPGDLMTSVDIEMIFDGQMPDDWNSGDHASHTVIVNGEVVDSSHLDEPLPPQAREMLMQQGMNTYRDLVNKAMASEDQQSEHLEMFIDLHSDEHENPEPNDHPMWQRIEESEIALSFMENEALVTLWGIDLIKKHVEPAKRVDMLSKLLASTENRTPMRWQRACRNAMLITLMETQAAMGHDDEAQATLMSMIEENMNGTRSKNTTEQE